MKNHKTKPSNIFVQAYKNSINEWRQNKTNFTIFLYHVALLSLFMPTKTFQEFHNCQGQCTANILYMTYLATSFLIGSPLLMTYIENLRILIDDKDSKYSQKSIANLFVKHCDCHAEINIATFVLLLTIIFIITGVYITIFPITLSLFVMTITIILLSL